MGKISQTDRCGRSLKLRICIFVFVASFATVLQAAGPGKAAIASAHYLATEAGHEILAQGGNAFDAAIAVSSVLAGGEQTSVGIGGGACWVLHRASDGFETMIDAREMAPAAAHKDMYLNADGSVNRELAVTGPLAAGIPGEIAGLDHLAAHYGKLSLAESLKPAIRIARDGFPVYEKFHRMLSYKEEDIRRWPAATEAFLVDGQVPDLGAIITLPDLAAVLEKVATEGRDGFYKGEIAQKLVDGVQAAGGIWTIDDMAGYTVKEREPVRTHYQGYELVTASPPSSGGIAIAEMLNILEPYQSAKLERVHRTHRIVEAIRSYGKDRTPFSMLSRGEAGVRRNCVIINLPGSSKGALESLQALFPGLLHIFPMLQGKSHAESNHKD